MTATVMFVRAKYRQALHEKKENCSEEDFRCHVARFNARDALARGAV